MRPGSPALDTRAPDLAGFLIIVRRDRPDVFEMLEQHFAEHVIGDRLTGERRQGQRRKGALAAKVPGRRHAERRDRPPETWTDHGFILVPLAEVAHPHTMKIGYHRATPCAR